MIATTSVTVKHYCLILVKTILFEQLLRLQTGKKIYTVCSGYLGSLNQSVQVLHYSDPILKTRAHISNQLPDFPEVMQTCLIISLNLLLTSSEAPTTWSATSTANTKEGVQEILPGTQQDQEAASTREVSVHSSRSPPTNIVNPAGAHSAPLQMAKSLIIS